RVFEQRRRRANIDAGAAKVAIGLVHRPAGSKGDASAKATSGQGDRTRVPQLVTSPDATRADNAHLWVEFQEGIALVGGRMLLHGVERPRLTFPRLVQGHADDFAGRLQLTAIVLGAGQAAMR